MWFHQPQPVCDCGTQSSVNERDFPVVNVPLHEFQGSAALREYEVVGHRFLIFEEIILDRIGLVAEAENEFLMAKVCVVFHHVPQDGPRSHRDHGLRNILRVATESHPGTTAKKYDFHTRSLRFCASTR